MKIVICTLLLLVTCLVMPVQIRAQTTDDVKKADSVNKIKATHQIIDKKLADFLVEAVDARMTDIKEGQLAIQLGTNSAIRDYGQLMVKDQTQMLYQLKALATDRNIMVPQSISNDKKETLKKLSEKTGGDFDQAFIKLMITDHERDIERFENAAQWHDSVVSKFATDHLPVLYKHLDSLKKIEKQNK